MVELPAALLVDTVTWVVLVPEAEKLSGGNANASYFSSGSIHMHLINVVILLVDFFATDVSFLCWDVWMIVPWPCWYGFFTICYSAAGHEPVYPFLHFRNYRVLGWLVGLVLMHVIFYFVCAGLGQLRDMAKRKCRGGAADELRQKAEARAETEDLPPDQDCNPLLRQN